MRKVLIFSALLVAGLLASQLLPIKQPVAGVIRLATMVALAFIMIHVGLEFDIDKSRPRQYVTDYLVASTAAAFPWIFCAAYFVYAMTPRELWGNGDLWAEVLLTARFASPTSAGVLFAMLAAAGLAATWLFGKARLLAIFDDLDTILLMIPLKIMVVGLRWELLLVIPVILLLLWLAWRFLHEVRLPTTWPFVLLYAVAIAAACELIYLFSVALDRITPIDLEVLLPAFVVGCMLARPPHHDPNAPAAPRHTAAARREKRVATLVSAGFMVLVGLSMPPVMTTAMSPEPAVAGQISNGQTQMLNFEGVDPQTLEQKNRFPGWGAMAIHVLAILLLSNLGKMVPAFVYRREAGWRQRLALAITMFPRGEVGAGVLVISLSYGIGGPTLGVAVISLALNLVLTGVFIVIVKRLITSELEERAQNPALA